MCHRHEGEVMNEDDNEINRLTTHFVGPDGPPDAKILVIGEAPGTEENYRRIPFVGSAGQLLDRCLRGVGISRSEVLIWNIFHQQPPKNDISYFFKDKSKTRLTEEGQRHIDKLTSWLFNLEKNRREFGIGPDIILACGEIPLRILTDKKGITNYRGSILPCTLVPGFRVYASFHPSYVNRLINEPEEVKLQGEKKKDSQNVLPLFMKDLERIRFLSENPSEGQLERKFEIMQTCEEAILKLDDILLRAQRTAFVRNKEGRIASGGVILAIDIETLPSSTGPILWCIGFSDDPKQAFTIPFLRDQKFVWTELQEARIISKISEVLLHLGIRKVFHSHYDMVILGKNYSLRCATGTYEDTMVGHQMNYPYLRKSLALCTSYYTFEPYYKDEGKNAASTRNDTQEFIYNCRDCAVTREIFPVIRKESFEIGTNNNYEISMYVMPSLIEMELRGVKVDIEEKANLAQYFARMGLDHEERIKILAEDRTINLNSSPQVIKLLYAKLGCIPVLNRKTKTLSADKDALNILLKKHHDPSSTTHQVLKNLSEYRRYSKLAQTYTSLETDQDGRVHTSYGFVSTFRLSSSESSLGGGGNLQNIPKRGEGIEVRKLFIPDKDMILIAADLSQAEAREVVWNAQDTALIKLFLEGWDVHWEKTKRIFSFSPDLELDKSKLISDIYTQEAHPMSFYRELGKTVVHASNYGMGAGMLQLILIRQGVWLEERLCKKLLEADRKANPLTARWQEDTREQINATRTLTTPMGDTRVFRGRLNNALYNSAIAFIPQSTVGRILEIATQKITDDLNEYLNILLNVHDELIVQTREKDVDWLIPEMKRRLEIPHEVKGRELIIPTDIKLGYNWKDLKDYKIGG